MLSCLVKLGISKRGRIEKKDPKGFGRGAVRAFSIDSNGFASEGDNPLLPPLVGDGQIATVGAG